MKMVVARYYLARMRISSTQPTRSLPFLTNALFYLPASLALPFYVFMPNNDEVAIKGDSFTFTCGTTWIQILRINWYKDNQLLRPDSPKTRAVIDFKPDLKAGSLVSTLKLEKLDIEDTGIYRCTISSNKSFVSGTSLLRVLPGGSKFCHSEITKTPKGVFHWDNIGLAGVARLPCPAGILRGIGDVKGFAYRKCDKHGDWMDVEGSECAYVDKVTQQLYNLKRFPANSTTVLAICKALYKVTENATSIKSDVDVSYVASILKSLQIYMSANQKVGKLVVRIISNMMNVQENILAEAQMRSKACSSFVEVLDALANSNVVGTYFISNNVGMNIVPVFPATFQGRTCAASLAKNGRLESILCNLPWQNVTTFSSPEPLEASIHLPKSLFAGQHIPPITEIKLKFMVYRNSKLFPHLRNGTLVANPRISTSVVNVQLGGIGAWMENRDCTLSKNENNTISYCTKLIDKSYFAVLMYVDQSSLASAKPEKRFMLEAMVYVGAVLCAFLLLITLVTYAVFRKLRYNRDDAAMLMNLCLALLVPVILFVGGIHHVTNTLMCRAVGVLLHYFVLCSLLWVGCGALCLCRLLRTAITPEEFNPVLRYYMISWGIPLIICGITVAGNPDNYNVENYCWLKPNPFLGAFVGPACLVIFVDIILYIRLNNLIFNTYSTMEDNTTPCVEEEIAVATTVENTPDQIASKCELIEHLNEVLPDKNDVLLYQKGSLLVLLMIVINFAAAFLLVKFQQPRSLYLVLSFAYALANITLGVIVFVFHCLKNAKAKKFWQDCFSTCFKRKNKYLVDHEVAPNTDSTSDKPSTSLMNGDAVRDNGTSSTVIPRIYGAPAEPVGSDIQSNVSLPSSAALTIDITVNNVKNHHKSGEVVDQAPKETNPGSPPGSVTTSMSDRQSCVSAPLPISHTQPDISAHPSRYSYCFADSANKKKKKKTKPRAPLALPDRNGISSSLESSMRAK
ncbi:hypothetical protein QZH41_013727, partial [Actinostola sp. cb2023]